MYVGKVRKVKYKYWRGLVKPADLGVKGSYRLI